ncbi:MAG: inorganic phosphate transporter [Deltaproteobacteria bacterium]|nr:inorganic phosphate transporter [Deltaproteobacteria bacterium]MCW5800849.1 inorganic phosphate transporter [Deltaproteobacteria bacterium]
MDASTIVVVTIAFALIFDVINGFHDAANSIATVVSTRVLSPRVAVLWAALANFIALFVFHQGVADTIAKTIDIQQIIGPDGKPIANPAYVWVVVCGLAGAIVWNLFTWYLGLPSSSSHALIGGLSGAGIAYGGWSTLQIGNISKTLYFIPLAPLIGLVMGSLIMFIVFWLFRKVRPHKVDRVFRVGQLISAGLYSVGHGGNDAQKTAGVIWAVMIAGGLLGKQDQAPYWVFVASYSAMAFGTAIGGWRIVKTMGMGLTHLKPVGGFCAEVAGAITLFLATYLKIPVSTTHTITGAIIGVGSVTKARGIRWGVATRIVYAWIFTIPAAAAVGAMCLLAARSLGAW